MPLFDFINEIGFAGFVDIAFMSLLIYTVLVWFKKTRTAFVVIGMSIVGGAYLVARVLGLSLTTTVFQAFFAVILILVIVIFQEEIKHFLENVGSRSTLATRKKKSLLPGPRGEVEILVRSLTDLAREKIGALVVVRGKEPILRYLDSGVDLNGELSEPLLKSLFDPHSAGHDGAVVITGDRVAEFSSHLPLSKNFQKLARTGTRHAAALGLAELSDALCLVVSEERGAISVARRADIRELGDSAELQKVLERFYEEVAPSQKARPWKGFFRENNLEKIVAIAITAVLWFFLVHESKITYRTLSLPVRSGNLPPHLIVSEIRPAEVHVTLSGTRRSFYFADLDDLDLSLRLFDAREGSHTLKLSVSNISVPDGCSLEVIQPDQVVVRLEPAPE
ncbi:MAG: diadenylate cyclase [Bacteroidota bacterium]